MALHVRTSSLLAFAVIVSAACGGTDILGGGPSALDERHDQWRAMGITWYAYDLDLSCFCLGPLLVTVEVANGEIVAVIERGTDDLLDESSFDRYYTIDGLFDLARRARDDADRFDIQYDAQAHFPTLIDIDWLQEAVDDEIVVRAGNLEGR